MRAKESLVVLLLGLLCIASIFAQQPEKLYLTSMGDTPDPFSPARTSNAQTANVKVHHSLLDNSPQHRFFLKLMVEVSGQAGKVRTLTTSQEINKNNGWIEATLTVAWDGKSDAGQVVSDGTYTYAAKAQLVRIKENNGIHDEQVIAESAPLNGTILLDATPPAITAQVSPPAQANGWHKSDVTVKG
ncbi:hypothetical protein HY772_09660, partial [Candidatus Woesearchaeota archaeon]|nr:hypothetical protein [Candidatus Woesearchaeota archaeon]